MVVGAGITGLSCAWRLVQAGFEVVVVDGGTGPATSRVAAGMLAPTSEHRPGEEALTALLLEAADRWPGFAAELEEASGMQVGLRRCGTLLTGFDADDRREVERSYAMHADLGLPAERLERSRIDDFLPGLSPKVASGVLVPGDHQVDPRATCDALAVVLAASGAQRHLGSVVAVSPTSVTLGDGSTLDADAVVVATGANAEAIQGLPRGSADVIRPVKGFTLRLAEREPLDLACTLRGLVEGRPVYVVPRESGEVVVGATSSEIGFDDAVEAGGLSNLLADALALLPGLEEAAFTGVDVGFRPATPDHAPIVGLLGGVAVALGSYRNGILLAPLLAEVVVEAIAGNEQPAVLQSFPVERFA